MGLQSSRNDTVGRITFARNPLLSQYSVDLSEFSNVEYEVKGRCIVCEYEPRVRDKILDRALQTLGKTQCPKCGGQVKVHWKWVDKIVDGERRPLEEGVS